MVIIKIGGGQSINLEGIVSDLSNMEQRILIVHGANAARDNLAKKLGYTKQVVTSVSGFSSVFSDRSAIELLMMAYAGLMNKRIVELCQLAGINAIGLSGLDGRMIQGRKNKGIRVQEGDRVRLIHDQSGKSESVNRTLLDFLIEHDYTPVLCVPIAGENGEALNSENDDIVCTIQRTFQAESVIHLIEAPGLLDNPSDERSLIPILSREALSERRERVNGRMKRKLYSIEKLFESGVKSVTIADGRVAHPIDRALAGEGTVIA